MKTANKNKAPIALFVYNREDHTRQTLDALEQNEGANESELIIFSDGPKTDQDKHKVKQIRELCQRYKGFKAIHLIESEQNKGLARSIVEGVSSLFEEYERLIVLEDDMLSSRQFLNYMNQALDHFAEEKKVWHISGWNYPIESEGLGDAFLWRAMNCWGWGSWRDRWKHYEKDAEKLINTFSEEEIRRFDLNGTSDFWQQVEMNASGDLNTWAIFWYATIFRNDGLCLNPSKTYILNTGVDGSGMHGGNEQGLFESKLSNKFPLNLEIEIIEDQIAVNRIQKLLWKINCSLLWKVKRKLGKLFKF